jgi:hypothetical protein
MKIAVTVVHNKTDSENEAQIDALLGMVSKVIETITQDQFDEEGNVIGQESFEVYHYEFTNLSIPHEVKFYHVIPYGVTKPANLDQLDGHKVFYGEGDQDKGETRFFNWGLKRGTDHGADISLYLEDVSQLNPKTLQQTFEELKSKANSKEFAEVDCGKMVTVKLLKELGQLDETKGKAAAITEYKAKITMEGLEVK